MSSACPLPPALSCWTFVQCCVIFSSWHCWAWTCVCAELKKKSGFLCSWARLLLYASCATLLSVRNLLFGLFFEAAGAALASQIDLFCVQFSKLVLTAGRAASEGGLGLLGTDRCASGLTHQCARLEGSTTITPGHVSEGSAGLQSCGVLKSVCF